MPVISSRLTPGLPQGIRRPVAAVLLVAVACLLAWMTHLAGWPREQVLATAILATTVLLWITETLPLFATSFISISLQVLLLGNPGGWRWFGFADSSGPTMRDFMSAAVDPVLLLFFSGLVLSRAAVKTGVDRKLAAVLLRPMTDSPGRLLAGVIVATSFFSLWMSNTATTALMLTLIVPILTQIEASHPFRKALVLAVPLSANVAGMSTPIASPPNAIAMSYITQAGLDITFVGWMSVAMPLVLGLLAATWWWLLRSYPPAGLPWTIELPDASLSRRGTWVVSVAALTFAVWVTEPFHGVPAPAAAALPVTLLFATAVITREDVNSLDWDVLILIAGGLALGYMLQVTDLDQRFAAAVPADASDWLRLAALAGATLALGTFFSNTAIASMFIPVAVVTAALSTTMGLSTYVIVTAFVASLSMALPMSTPPNAMAYGSGELASRDFIRTGGLVGIAGALTIVGLAIAWARWTM
jgi:sodium-dependent dicarboxylate transporter 2/3/5